MNVPQITDFDLGKGAVGSYAVNDRTIFAAITINGITGYGVAKCMPKDKFSEEVGSNIALGRALESIAQYLTQTWVARSITQEEYNAKHGRRKSR